MNRDKAFIVEKIRKEKRKGRQQGNLILNLKQENTRLKVNLDAKDEEIKKLEIKLLRAQNMTFGNKANESERDDDAGESNGP